MCREDLYPRAELLAKKFSEVCPEAIAQIQCLASDAFAEYGAPYQVRPIADSLSKPLKIQFLKALYTVIEAPENRDGFKARGLRSYVAMNLSASVS